MFSIFPFMVLIIYLTIIIVAFYFVYTWVNKIISLKQEHNHLLREILKQMENK